jgi:hypothetical protein
MLSHFLLTPQVFKSFHSQESSVTLDINDLFMGMNVKKKKRIEAKHGGIHP